MAKNGRPPMKAAREAAIKQLIEAHTTEYEASIAAFLWDRDWEEAVTSTTRWVHKGES